MTQLLNSLRRYWPYCVVAAVVVIELVTLLAWDRVRDQQLSEARAQIARLQERVSRAGHFEEKRAWGRLDEAAVALAEADSKVRKEALAKFRQELHRLKVRYAYPQLGAVDPEERDR
jgi:hypothetical protein